MTTPYEAPRLRCFLALRYGQPFQRLREAVERAVQQARFQSISLEDEQPRLIPFQQVLAGELARADCLIADMTGRNANVFFEVGLAQAMEKPSFLLIEKSESDQIPFDLQGLQYISYENTLSGLTELTKKLTRTLREYRRSPRRARVFSGARLATPFFVDWDRLERTDAENLCRELLTQMGYQRVDWVQKSQEFDLIAELPKKDPDGFEYRELWLVAMGRNAPPEMVIEMMAMEPEIILHRIQRYPERLERSFTESALDTPVTLLVILLGSDRPVEELERRMRLNSERHLRRGLTIRLRVWDRSYLTSLVQQFPQIGYKYFSDEGRSPSKFRKSYEDLYRDYVELSNRQAALIAAFEDEKNKRVRAERDAIWKDISFAAAHNIGNPLFAIETYLDPLTKRIDEHRTEEALEVVRRVRTSVEKAKGIVDQFKSLTRTHKITPVTTLLRPILEDGCRTAEAQGVSCEIDCEPDVTVKADPERLAECFDELAFNSTHWFDKPSKRIEVRVTQPTASQLPPSVDSSQGYQLIQFKDNGPGIPVDKKEKIFDAFYTTRDNGTGLGLALVRRILEGHGGAILETGIPGKGAEFEIYLPRGEEPPAEISVSVREPASKKKSSSTKKRQSAKRRASARQSVKKG